MLIYKAKDGDILDYVCWKHYGNIAGVTEKVLELNRHLEDADAVLKAGTEIILPEITIQKQDQIVRLWS